MELNDLIEVSEWKKIAEDIHNKFGFNGTIYKHDNFILTKSDVPANSLCPVIKSSKDSLVICSSAQQRLAKIAYETKAPATGECDAGFIKFVLPVFVKDQFLGMVGGCGCLLDGASVDTFYVAKLGGKDEKEIKALSTNLPRISLSRLSEAIAYTRECINRILEKKA